MSSNVDFVQELEARLEVWAQDYMEQIGANDVSTASVDALTKVIIKNAFKAGVRKAVIFSLEKRLNKP